VLHPRFAASIGFDEGNEVEFIDFSGVKMKEMESFDLILEGVLNEQGSFMHGGGVENAESMCEMCDQFAKDGLFKKSIRREIRDVLDGFPISQDGIRLRLLLFGLDWKIYVKPVSMESEKTMGWVVMSPISTMKLLTKTACENESERDISDGDAIDDDDGGTDGKDGKDARSSTGPHFRDIGGLEREKELVMATLRRSLFERNAFVERHGVLPPQGILIHGPHGTGKTMLGVAALNEIKDLGFSNIKTKRIVASSLINPYIGESESKLKDAFSTLIDGSDSESKGVIFIDEVDVIACNRHRSDATLSNNRLLGTLISLLDASIVMSGHVFVIASTNEIDSLDPSIRRPGRFDVEMEIGIIFFPPCCIYGNYHTNSFHF
jgi:hypothetical protein